jgi:hypothetical protein
VVNRLLLAIAVWLAFGLVCLIGTYAHAEPAFRLVVTLTCDDIRTLVAWQGWAEIETRAKAAGASQAQLDQAKKCLK